MPRRIPFRRQAAVPLVHPGRHDGPSGHDTFNTRVVQQAALLPLGIPGPVIMASSHVGKCPLPVTTPSCCFLFRPHQQHCVVSVRQAQK